jgi:hypothetical protein
MKTTKANETVLDGVDEGRREFVKKLVAGTAFAAPLLASFSMDGALIGEAEAAGSTYYAPYCGDRDLSTAFTAKYHVDSVRFNATVIADVLDGTTISVVVNFTPRNDFKYAELILGGITIVDSLQLGPNVISTEVLEGKGIIGDPTICAVLDSLTGGSGYISVTTYDHGTVQANLVAHG